MSRKVLVKRDLLKGWLAVWGIGIFSLALWLTFTPFLAMEQARQLAVCLAGLCFLHMLSVMESTRKWLARGREWHGSAIAGSTA